MFIDGDVDSLLLDLIVVISVLDLLINFFFHIRDLKYEINDALLHIQDKMDRIDASINSSFRTSVGTSSKNDLHEFDYVLKGREGGRCESDDDEKKSN